MAWKDCPVCRGGGRTHQKQADYPSSVEVPMPCPVCTEIDRLRDERDQQDEIIAGNRYTINKLIEANKGLVAERDALSETIDGMVKDIEARDKRIAELEGALRKQKAEAERRRTFGLIAHSYPYEILAERLWELVNSVIYESNRALKEGK